MSKAAFRELVASVSVTSSSDASIAEVSLRVYPNENLNWTGTSKRFSGDKERGITADKPNRAIGERLAIARAFRNAAAQLERQAIGFTKSIDDNRKHSQEAKSKPKPKFHRVKGRYSPKDLVVETVKINAHKKPANGKKKKTTTKG